MNRRDLLKLTIGASAFAAMPTIAGIAARASDPIKVGVLLPQSGPGGLFGPSCENATNLAVSEINDAGGILGRMVEPVFADVGGPPAEATQAALRLWRGENVEAFVGMHDSAVRGALTNLFKGEIPYIYTPVYEGGECSPGTFVLGETPTQQLEPVIPWMAQNKGASNWYLIGNDYNWPRDTNAAAKAYIEASGGTVVGEEYLPFTADNFDSNLAKIKSSGADAVLITLVGGASVGFNRAFASFGLPDTVVRLGTLIEENTLAGIGAENSQNLYASAGYFGNIDTPAAKAFAAAYQDKFGADAAALNSLGESCYEGMKFLEALAKKAGSVDVAAFEASANGTSYDGPRGTATMSDRHVSKDIYLAEADGAAFRVIETFPAVAAGNNCQ
ncbi:MAG: substrate-binding domain-containing protein [Pseudomonadota bacterium]